MFETKGQKREPKVRSAEQKLEGKLLPFSAFFFFSMVLFFFVFFLCSFA
jgi:hypothetical protein